MLPKFAINHRIVILFIVAIISAGGIHAYLSIGRLEDPDFTLKTALVVTVYPGASARDVEEHVTDIVERSIQRLKGVENIRSVSRPGVSIIFVDMLETTNTSALENAWKELRYKVSEIQMELPPESLPPMVKDDFGEVYGIVLAFCADDGFTPSEHLNRARELQRELGLLPEVGRVELWGAQKECIEVEISRARMAELAVPPALVLSALARQNLSFSSGSMTVDGEVIRISPTGKFETLSEIENLVIMGTVSGTISNVLQNSLDRANAGSASGLIQKQVTSSIDTGVGSTPQQIRLRDIATIRRTTVQPTAEICRFGERGAEGEASMGGQNAIAIAIAPRPNGNVVHMGEQVRQRAKELMNNFPAGYDLKVITYQPDNVNIAVHAFMKNLYEAVIIVTIVVMIAMGLRSGILITSSLLVVILATMCCLLPMGVVLQRTSLGAFIVALGILVDDAVVVGDLILVRMQRGMPRKEACIEGARRAAFQLLGATIVGMLAFLPIYLSPNLTGEYCGSLFLVVSVSLGISWFVAMLQTPVAYYYFVHVKGENKDSGTGTDSGTDSKSDSKPAKDPHGGPVYRGYRRSLEWVLHHRAITLALILSLLGLALVEFRHVKQIFFPPAQRAQFFVDYWLPEGSNIDSVAEDLQKIEAYLLTQPRVKSVASFAGGGPPRFYLPYEPELPNSSYGQIVVNVDSIHDANELIRPTDIWLKEHFPQAQAYAKCFAMGPISKHEVEVRFRGPDEAVLARLSAQAEEIFRNSPYARNVSNNWRQPVLTLVPEFSQTRGQRVGLTRTDMLLSLSWATSGLPIASYPEGDLNIPIYVRGLSDERNDIENLTNTPIWGILPNNAALGEVTSGIPVKWENGLIYRRNRVPTMTVGADALDAQWTQLIADVRPAMRQIALPEGYTLEWGGQEEQSIKATSAVMGKLPLALIFMALIVVALFNGMRQPLIIALTFPLAIIGITFGLIVFDKPFGFMALLGGMSLLGMVVRNGVVLMDQIDEEMKLGEAPYQAVLDASVERMRPVVVAALTVVVGMIPLLKDPLFDSMATTVMFGLIVSTFLTLYVVPILYTLFFKIKTK